MNITIEHLFITLTLLGVVTAIIQLLHSIYAEKGEAITEKLLLNILNEVRKQEEGLGDYKIVGRGLKRTVSSRIRPSWDIVGIDKEKDENL